jgi:hypothetical protein
MSGEAAMIEEGEDFVELRATRQIMRAKILHTLSIWPYLNPSMLQVGIGTAVSPRIWHPVKEALIKEGLIVQEEIRARSHVGRDQVYTILRLSTAPQHVTPLDLPQE